jgi:hypothetical protein
MNNMVKQIITAAIAGAFIAAAGGPAWSAAQATGASSRPAARMISNSSAANAALNTGPTGASGAVLPARLLAKRANFPACRSGRYYNADDMVGNHASCIVNEFLTGAAAP